MFKRLWSYLTGDSVGSEAAAFGSGGDFPRYLYSKEMIDQINMGRRYQLLANRSQTEIYILDDKYKQRVAKFYDISYALIVADSLNNDSGSDD